MEIFAAILVLLVMVLVIAALTILILLIAGVRQLTRPLNWEGALAWIPFFLCGLFAVSILSWYRTPDIREATPAPSPPVAVAPAPSPPVAVAKTIETPAEFAPATPKTPTEDAAAPAEPVAGTDAVEIVEFIGPNTTRNVKALPDWARTEDEPQVTKTGERITLVSRRYSTINEAEAELRSRLEPALAEWLSRGRWQSPAQSLSSAELVEAGLITRRVQERFDVHVGAFTESVYRISWQVDWSPEARTALMAKWLPKLQSRRVQYLVALLVILTALFRIWSAVLKLHETRLTKYRGVLTLGASVLTVVCVVALVRAADPFLGT